VGASRRTSDGAVIGPGTAVFSLIFTLLFQLILEHTRDIVIAVGMNMVVYTYIIFASPGTSPLPANDYFSNPVSALLTMYVAHMILIGIAYFIRREQQKRDEVRLLVEQQRADILRQFLSYASHDLRTPLTKIDLKLHLLEVKSDDPRAQNDIADLKEFVSELESLVLSMLEMASLDSPDEFAPRRVDPDLMIVDVLALYTARAKQKRVLLGHQSNLVDAEIHVDDVYFRRALSNILENAIAHTPEAGRIDVRVSRSGEQVHIVIKDTGEGIAEEHLPFIFDRFYRADSARNQETGRNGLGLAIARKIIELHGGSISVQSEVGVGSAFTITVPLFSPS
jgi:signal transduction histidine kinase